MTSLYLKANHFDKEFLYDYYLSMINKPLPYDKITRKKILEAIVEYYNIEDHLLNALSMQEIELLNKIYNKKEKILTDQNRGLIIELSSKLLLDYSYFTNDIYIYEELRHAVGEVIKKVNTEDGKKILELQQVCIGVCNAYGILSEEEFYDCVHRYFSGYSQEEIKKIIMKSDYFGHRMALLEITYDNIPITLYTHKDLEEVAEFLESYIDVLSLPKYEFNYNEILDYASYGINYKNPSLQRLLKNMRQFITYFDEEYFCNLIQTTTNLLLEPNTIKKYIYDHYPHYERNADRFFDLMDLCDEVNETLNTWTARGYPVSKMTDLLSGIQLDSMKKMERAYRYKTGLEPEDDLNDFLDFVESATEAEIDNYLDTKDKTKIN